MVTSLNFPLFSHRSSVAGFALLGAALLFAPCVEAQRPSVAEMQAQIDALTFPYDEPAAQVRTALDILPVFQDAVVSAFFETGVPPYDRQEAGLSQNPEDTQTSFISEVDIVDGAIVFTFGNDADATLINKTLSFNPYVSTDNTVIWRCGEAPINAGVSLLGNTYIPSSIPTTAQPSPCILKAYAGNQLDVLKAQILEPFGIVETFKAAVEFAGAALGTPSQPIPPVNRTEAGLSANATDTLGNYFDSIDVIDGVVAVTYGNDVNAALVGYVLHWTPYETPDGTIVWRCGNANQLAGTDLMGTAASGNTAQYQYSDVPNLYLPPQCRP